MLHIHFYGDVNFINTTRRLYLIIISIVAGAILSSVYGILQHLGLDIFKWSSFEARRVFSAFGNPVFFSAYLVIALPIAVALFFYNVYRQKETFSNTEGAKNILLQIPIIFGFLCIIINHLYSILAYKYPRMFCCTPWRTNSTPLFNFHKTGERTVQICNSGCLVCPYRGYFLILGMKLLSLNISGKTLERLIFPKILPLIKLD